MIFCAQPLVVEVCVVIMIPCILLLHILTDTAKDNLDSLKAVAKSSKKMFSQIVLQNGDLPWYNP